MKRIIAMMIVIALTLNCVSTYVLPRYEYSIYAPENRVSIHERVGETIDAQEGQHYGLFTAIEGFKSATLYTAKSGGYVIEIETENDTLVALNGDTCVVLILNDHIRYHHDTGVDRAAFESTWGILAYDTLGIPITVREVNSGVQYSHAYASKQSMTCCAGMSTFSLLAAMAIAGGGSSGGDDIGVALVAAAGAIVLAGGLLIGGITAGIIYHFSQRDADAIIQEIKDARKPGHYGVSASMPMR